MKLTLKNAAFSLALCCLASCANEAPWGGSRGKGGIDLKLTADADVKDALPSVRAGAPELMAPDVANFGIEMRNVDTDQVQTWKTLEEFNAVESFDVGSYVLTAFYGSAKECGFDKPYFSGEAYLNVLEGRETEVEVTAQLANVMLSVDYTEDFKNYFRNYSVIAHSDGHANVVFGKTETRAGFLTAGDVTLQLSITNPSGKSVTLTPAQFPAVARHHYHVTFDVNADPVSGAVLEVVFDDSLSKENVIINLSDELYNADAPIVHAEGFNSGVQVEALSGNPAPSPLKFESICKGGLKTAVLKIAQISGDKPFAPSFGNELDLIQADEATQYELEQNGIKVAGLFKNPDQMAIVDVTELPKYLPEGTFEITLTVSDLADRNNEEPVTLKLATLPIKLEVIEGSALYEVYDLSSNPTVDATVKVSYNGFNPEKCISFQNLCRTGIYKDCKIIDVKESTATRGFTDKTYIFNIQVCDVENSPLPMKLFFNDEKKKDFTIDVIEPEYSLIKDAFATYARFKVVTDNAADIPTIVNGTTLYIGDDALANVTKDPENGILTIEGGLEPDTDYTIGYSLTKCVDGIPELHTVKIHTEPKTLIPNGDFSKLHSTISYDNLQVGGQYTYKVGITYTYTNLANVRIQEPDYWASVNAKTFYTGAKNKNSWYMVVSTFSNPEGGMTLRSVAYDYDGATLAKTATEGTKNHYCKSVPADFAFRSAGELYLGSYSFDGTKGIKNEGVNFTSRPRSLSFDYTYSPIGADMGYVEIILLDKDKKIIGSSNKKINKGAGTMTLYIDNYTFGVEAEYLKVGFKSSAGEVETVTPDPSVDSWDGNLPVTPYQHHFDENAFHTFASGSVLTIDNVKLNY